MQTLARTVLAAMGATHLQWLEMETHKDEHTQRQTIVNFVFRV